MVKSNNRRNDIILMLIVILAFGPYIVGPVRVEHIYLYTLFIISIFRIVITKDKYFLIKPIFLLITLMVAYILWVTIITILENKYTSILQIIADIESYIQPIVVIIVTTTFFRYDKSSIDIKINKIFKVLVLILSINSVIAIISMLIKDISFLQVFHTGSRYDGSLSVAYKSFTMGRYTGIFNQPLESGVTYSLGILIWIYIYGNKKNKIFDYIKLVLLIIGGFLSVSKMFIIGGIPISILYYLNIINFKFKFNPFEILIMPIVIFPAVFILNKWNGLSYFFRLFNFKYIYNEGILNVLTGGRFGSENATLISKFSLILQESPIYGFGLASSNGFDNAYLQYLHQGGIVGLIIYLMLILIIILIIIELFKSNFIKDAKLVGCIILIILILGIGGPIITLNRFSTILWLVLSMLIVKLHIHLKG